MYAAGAFSGGRLFSFGGYYYYNNAGSWYATYSNMIHAYDISSNTWTTLSATLTSARYYLTAAAVATSLGERIYVIGGTPGTGTNDEFNPSNDTVTGRTPVTANGSAVALYLHASAAISSTSKVYVMGGLPTVNANVYEFTTPTSAAPNGSWTTRAQVQNGAGQAQATYYRAAMTLNNRLYITGGVLSPYTQCFEYNSATDTWAQRANMSGGRYGHAAVAIGNKGYVYGGYNAYTTCEEFTPPNFGSSPFAPSAVSQVGSRPESSLQSLADETQFDGWTNSQIVFSATVTDPDPGQQVRFRVQVKPQGASWNSAASVVSLTSGLVSQGTISIPWAIPSGDGFDWRYRIEDSYNNSHPAALANLAAGWIEAFGTESAPNVSSPDFRSDQETPAEPVPQWPHNVDIQVPDAAIGDVELQWIESTDNGPVAGISYELQVATEGGFSDIEAQLFSTAGQSTYPITLSVSRYDKFWRMRARDVGGNFSEWSAPLNFRVTFNDGVDHGAGDAAKTCAFGVESGGPSFSLLITTVLLGLALCGREFRAKRRGIDD
jgi:hypothetical protein